MLGTHSDISKLKDYELELEAKNKEIASQNQEYAEVNEELQLSLQELRETNVQLEEAKEKAEESDRLKSAFLANMSHEIRTPMNSILGFSDLLTQHNLSDEKRRKFSKLVNNSGEQLMRLINDIIDISKIESNQLEVDKKWCKVNVLIDEIVTAQKQNKNFILKESLKLNITKLNDIDSVILTDPFRVKQILDNLLNNAIKFTDNGSIELGYEIKEYSGDSFIEFFVKDSGVGIPEKSHGDIFKRFVQADNHQQNTGTGLGLSITKGMLELLGG
jgi:signal transduction histidine kinase